MPWSQHFSLAKIWFLIDIVLALTPSIYWAADRYKVPILGMPATLFYFLVVCLSVTGSILYAYWEESSKGEFTS